MIDRLEVSRLRIRLLAATFASAAIALLVALLWPVTAGAREPELEHDVLPILAKKCMSCHGGLIRKGELDLRTLKSMLKGGESGPAVVAGKPESSELWKRVVNDEMPKGRDKLTAAEKGLIRDWIAAGLPTFARSQTASPVSISLPREKREVREVAAAVDAHIVRRLEVAGLKAAPQAQDAEFLRRITLDLAGRVPAPEQAAAFLDDPAPDKRARLIDALLAAPEFGVQFGRTWRDWISPPELPSDMNSGKQPHKETRDLGDWLGRRFAAGDPWHRIVRDILTVSGDIKSNPEIIFFGLAGQDAKATPDGSARTVASLFMGVQIQCAQCHDDPYRDWSQTDFWGLASFFGNVTGDFKKLSEKPGEGRIAIPKTAFRNEGKQVSVAFLGGTRPAATKASAWRPVLADWLTAADNPYLARAFVNRLWFQLFARGIVNPVDDLRELNPPSHPELLALLADQFAASGFDVKHLVRCLCNSQAYQRTSRTDPGLGEASRDEQARLFGRAPLRIMTADMLLDSLKLVYGDPKLDLRSIGRDDGNANGESAAVGDPYLEFQRAFCTNEEDATDFTHGIPQMLTFINHPRLRAGSRALEVYRKSPAAAAPERTVEWLYLATLSRRPTREELAEASAYVARAREPGAACNDVLWMLVNRSEFLCIR